MEIGGIGSFDSFGVVVVVVHAVMLHVSAVMSRQIRILLIFNSYTPFL